MKAVKIAVIVIVIGAAILLLFTKGPISEDSDLTNSNSFDSSLPDNWTLTYKRIGGVAGFMDNLQIQESGAWDLESREASTNGALSDSELSELKNLITETSFLDKEDSSENNEETMPDALYQEIILEWAEGKHSLTDTNKVKELSTWLSNKVEEIKDNINNAPFSANLIDMKLTPGASDTDDENRDYLKIKFNRDIDPETINYSTVKICYEGVSIGSMGEESCQSEIGYAGIKNYYVSFNEESNILTIGETVALSSGAGSLIYLNLTEDIKDVEGNNFPGKKITFDTPQMKEKFQ